MVCTFGAGELGAGEARVGAEEGEEGEGRVGRLHLHPLPVQRQHHHIIIIIIISIISIILIKVLNMRIFRIH